MRFASPDSMAQTTMPASRIGTLPYWIFRNLAVPLFLFLIIWTPRVIDLNVFTTADESRWLQRSVNFAVALTENDWAATFQREHPGVTTTWLGAAGVFQAIPDLQHRVNSAPEVYKAPFETWLAPETGFDPLDLLTIARIWVTFVVAIALTATYFPLRRLIGDGEAAVALLFIALSPMNIAFSRQLQPDGFVSSMYFASAAFFLAWLYAGLRRRDLLIAGVLMGLAWLTKTPSALLAPAGGILVLIELGRQWRTRRTVEVWSRRSLWSSARPLVLGYVLWGVIAAGTFFLLWPALWVNPLDVFTRMFKEMSVYAEGHSNPNFFMGKIVEDPGVLFYPFAYVWRTTPAQLIGLLLAAVAAGKRYGPFSSQRTRKAAFGFLLFAVVFALAMTFIGKKFDRYLLPAFLPLDVLVGLGWIAGCSWLANFILIRVNVFKRRRQTTQAFLVPAVVLAGGIIALHGVFAAATAPYYLTYFNPLLGGAPAASKQMFVGWGEGLDMVGNWLAEQPDPTNVDVLSWYSSGPLSYHFPGRVVGFSNGSRMPWLDVDYVVLYINQVQRNIPTAVAVNYFLHQEPVYTAMLEGVPMARVYNLNQIVADLSKAEAPPTPVQVTAQWPEVALVAMRTHTTPSIGTALPVEMEWSGTSTRPEKVSLRLISSDGTLVAQQDVPLRPKVTVSLFVPPDAPPGAYTLYMMVYDSDTLDPVRTIDGQDLIAATSVRVAATDLPAAIK